MALKMTTLKNQVAIVTGASQGIGLAVVEALVAVHADVIAIDCNRAGIDRLSTTHPGVTAVCGDVCSPALCVQLDEVLGKMRGRVDILCNNAAIARGQHALQTSDEDFDGYYQTNVLSVFRLSRWAVRYMATAGRGAIVNIASVFGMVGAADSVGYSTSKAAVIGLTRQMANDFGPNGVRVNAVAPGLIETPLTADRISSEGWRRTIMIDGTPLRRVGKPVDVARAVRFLASDEASFISGHTLVVDGGWAMGRYPREKSIAVEG